VAECFVDDVSVVIANADRADMTVKAVEHVGRSTGGYVREILVLDNGSGPEELAELRDGVGDRGRLIPLGVNRHFGEGSNIGAEMATGRLLLLLSSAVYVEPDCIAALGSSMEKDSSTTAVGPTFLYPGGALQRIGGRVLESGDILSEEGDGTCESTDEYPVEYSPAACLLVRRREYLSAGGFSLQWEPGQYEDVDLCLTLRARGGRVLVNPRARAVHIPRLPDGEAKVRLEIQREINRLAFLQKWGGWLGTGRDSTSSGHASAPDRPRATVEPAPGKRDGWDPVRKVIRHAVLYTPYEVVPGGGERVLFELAGALVEAIGAPAVRIATPYRYSDLRMRELAETFGVQAPGAALTLEEMRSDPPDLSVVLGNEVVPPIAGNGRILNVYVCQFPFDAPEQYILRNGAHLATFDEIWVYSDFVRHYVNGHIRRLGLPAPRIRVVYPPATLPTPADLRPWRERSAVLTVGRFFRGGHNKRQDVVIEIVKQLAERFGCSVPLVVAGSLHASTESQERFRELVELSGGIECSFYPNASRERLLELYASSAVLVHAAGYGVDRYSFPERLEHFGIVPLEAASLGCIPLVYDDGGPAEVMGLLGSSMTYRSIPQAAAMINDLFADPARAEALSDELRFKTSRFSRQAFRGRVREALTSRL
jgi:GT2 family glycosyltransferase/glycosyltransferase involved in cell wall biosynthesis